MRKQAIDVYFKRTGELKRYKTVKELFNNTTIFDTGTNYNCFTTAISRKKTGEYENAFIYATYVNNK